MRALTLIFALALSVFTGCKAPPQPQALTATSMDLLGAYYRGDRLFYHVHLHIRRDQSYEATATSDMGVAATRSKGTWKLTGSALTLTPKEETGIRWIFPMRRFEVVIRSGSVILIPEDREWYDKSGPSTHSCFQRVEFINAPAEVTR